jgi:hypothetical protein
MIAITNKNIIISSVSAKKITVIRLIMASFILAIAYSSNLQFAEAHNLQMNPILNS